VIYFQIFLSFMKCGLFTFGGGYAMLPMMERIIAKKQQWATPEEIAELFALGQVLPGVVAVNTATFVGIKQKGVLGGIVAALGVITPSLVVVTLVASFFATFMEVEVVRNAFSGIFIAACALIISAVWKLFRACVKPTEKDGGKPRQAEKIRLSLTLLCSGLAFAAILFGISPVIVVAVTALIAVLTSVISGARRSRT
jgi:chromate transporter